MASHVTFQYFFKIGSGEVKIPDFGFSSRRYGDAQSRITKEFSAFLKNDNMKFHSYLYFSFKIYPIYTISYNYSEFLLFIYSSPLSYKPGFTILIAIPPVNP